MTTSEPNGADESPLSPEMLDAFPLGALSMLSGVSAMVATRHGVDVTRNLLVTLASDDGFWRRMRERFEPSPADAASAGSAAAPAAAPATTPKGKRGSTNGNGDA